MSREAMEAVQDHSQFDVPECYYQFRVLLAIASFADKNGRAGVIGKAKQCPSQRALAERAKIHRNTFTTYLDDVLESGEAEIVDSGGAGRGAWTVYQINLPMPESRVPISEKRYTGSQGADTDNSVPIMEKLVQIEQLLVQINGTFGTQPPLNGVQDTNRYHKDTPPNPPRGANGEGVGRTFNEESKAVLDHLEGYGISGPRQHEVRTWGEWLRDIDKLIGIAGSAKAACDLLDRVKAYMDENELSYARPGSFVKIARRMANEGGPDAQLEQEANEQFDFILHKAETVGRMRWKDWGMSEKALSALKASLGTGAIQIVTGRNPERYREKFVNEYVKR